MVKGKTILVEDLDELRDILEREFPMQVYPGLNVQFFIDRAFFSKLRIDIGSERMEYGMRFMMQPVRNLKLDDWEQEVFIFSPSISGSLADNYRQRGIPHGDLNGRLFFINKEEGQLVDIRPEHKKYGVASYERDLFSAKASRVVRAFLCEREHLFTQEELMQSTGVSRSLVSQLLKLLCSRGYVEQRGEASREAAATYITAEFDQLLDEWVRNDDWKKRVKVYEYSVLSNDVDKIISDLDLALRAANFADNVAFTQWSAAWKRRPHTTPPVVSAYLRRQDKYLLAAVPGRPVDSGGNLWILIPKDEGVFQHSQTVDGVNLVSDVQIYLDLLQVGLRGPEQAKELREWEGFAK
ncbi:MAG: DNA-binding MarR family transcriptional regulator [Rubritalea sp.]|jgi:DNA-binding MarR family transcriptional regulator